MLEWIFQLLDQRSVQHVPCHFFFPELHPPCSWDFMGQDLYKVWKIHFFLWHSVIPVSRFGRDLHESRGSQIIMTRNTLDRWISLIPLKWRLRYEAKRFWYPTFRFSRFVHQVACHRSATGYPWSHEFDGSGLSREHWFGRKRWGSFQWIIQQADVIGWDIIIHTKSWRSWNHFDVLCVAYFRKYTDYLCVLRFDPWSCPLWKSWSITHINMSKLCTMTLQSKVHHLLGTAGFSHGHRFFTRSRFLWCQVTRWSTWLMTFARFARTFSASNRSCWDTWSAPWPLGPWAPGPDGTMTEVKPKSQPSHIYNEYLWVNHQHMAGLWWISIALRRSSEFSCEILWNPHCFFLQETWINTNQWNPCIWHCQQVTWMFGGEVIHPSKAIRTTCSFNKIPRSSPLAWTLSHPFKGTLKPAWPACRLWLGILI